MSTILKQVYLIDDDPTFNFITKLLLKKISFAEDVVDFSDASEALARLQNNAAVSRLMPDLIFLDLNMPGMDGWDFLDVYKTLPSSFLQHCKLYILTSSIDPSDKSKSLSYQCVTDFITKPLALEKVIRIKEDFKILSA